MVSAYRVGLREKSTFLSRMLQQKHFEFRIAEIKTTGSRGARKWYRHIE